MLYGSAPALPPMSTSVYLNTSAASSHGGFSLYGGRLHTSAGGLYGSFGGMGVRRMI